MKELVIATANKGKFLEIQALLQGTVDMLFSAADFPDLPAVVEDGATFSENAVKKAKISANVTGKPVIADDSGLLVDALNGHPGVLSARFAGESAEDAANNAKLLKELAGVPEQRRTAAFHCVIALCLPGGNCLTFDGELPGVILDAPRGEGGFGYDSLFLVPEFGKTLAELPMDVKNAISHRGKALNKLKEYLGGCELPEYRKRFNQGDLW